jgi:hypothetical protein
MAQAPYTAPAPENLFRWRVQLDCGCIHELLTFGDDKASHEHQWRDAVGFNLLPAGQLMCWHEEQRRSVPYRDITEWGARKGEPSPDEQPDPSDELAAKRGRASAPASRPLGRDPVLRPCHRGPRGGRGLDARRWPRPPGGLSGTAGG